MRFGRKLGFTEAFFHAVCDRVVKEMGEAYPELVDRRDVIARVVSREEEVFIQTFDEGARALVVELKRLAAAGEKVIGGEFLFWLHDERGLQPDLADLIAGERGFTIDRAGYDSRMTAKRSASGKSGGGAGDTTEELYRNAAAKTGSTDYVGYEAQSSSSVVSLLVLDGVLVGDLPEGSKGDVVLDTTPFYAESGGQTGDTGELRWEGGLAKVLNAKKAPGGLVVHEVEVTEGILAMSATVEATVEPGRHRGICAHHSATHLLHWALEAAFGDHVKQEGSLVKEDLLRFDFRHFSPLTAEDTTEVESLIAQAVLEDTEVTTAVASLQEAVASGAKAFFDEKYEEDVRVVAMGGAR